MANSKRQSRLTQRTGEGRYRKEIAPVRKELAAAYTVVGNTPPKRLKWLLLFADKNLDELSQGRLVDLGWEVVMFGVNKKPNELEKDWDSFFNLGVLTAPYNDEERSKRRDKGVIPLNPSHALVRKFHSTMQKVFDQLFEDEWWEYQPPAKVYRIALSIKGSDGAYRANEVRDVTADELLMACAFDLIKAEKARLGICQNPNCKRRFATLRKTIGKFCSSRCSAYVRVNRARGKLLINRG